VTGHEGSRQPTVHAPPDPFGGRRADLEATLTEGQRRGFLGPGPVARHLDHAALFVAATGGRSPETAGDLGSGAGIPALALAVAWRHSTWVLVESQRKRAVFLQAALAELGLDQRCRVVAARAEEVGRDAAHRGRLDLVTARSFGPPAVTAECAAPLLRVGGRLLVSDRRDAGDRWPAGPLEQLGLAPAGRWEAETGAIQVLEQRELCPERYPRRVGLPARRPLFDVSRETGRPMVEGSAKNCPPDLDPA
jgi:16S rRNA (guanine527-N7)-methyltransferase